MAENQDDVEHIGIRLKKIRKESKLRQEDLAAQLQIAGVMLDSSNISKIERGVRDVSGRELLIFAKVLNVCPYLLAGVVK